MQWEDPRCLEGSLVCGEWNSCKAWEGHLGMRLISRLTAPAVASLKCFTSQLMHSLAGLCRFPEHSASAYVLAARCSWLSKNCLMRMQPECVTE